MEGKAHSKERYSAPGSVSRMEQDLANCSRDFKASFKQRLPIRHREHAKEVNACIVGAGLAGLRCAEILIEEGVRVTIIEARERIGGRVSPTSDEPRLLLKLLQVHQANLLGHEVDM